MKLLGSTKSKITRDENDVNEWNIIINEINEILLIYC